MPLASADKTSCPIFDYFLQTGGHDEGAISQVLLLYFYHLITIILPVNYYRCQRHLTFIENIQSVITTPAGVEQQLSYP